MMMNYLSSIYENNSNVDVAYIYCNYKEQKYQTTINLIETLLQHLLITKVENNDIIADKVENVYRRHLSLRTRSSLKELIALLSEAVIVNERIYFVIDALNKCFEGDGTRKVFLEFLRDLRKLSRISLLITSRFVSSIQNAFEEESILKICADIYNIRKFIQYNVQRHRRLDRFIQRVLRLQKTIVQVLTQNAQEMFLMFMLQMKAIAQAVSIKQLLKSLHQLSSSLKKVYSEYIRRIDERVYDERVLAHATLF